MVGGDDDNRNDGDRDIMMKTMRVVLISKGTVMACSFTQVTAEGIEAPKPYTNNQSSQNWKALSPGLARHSTVIKITGGGFGRRKLGTAGHS